MVPLRVMPETRPSQVVLQANKYTGSSVGLQGRKSSETNCSIGTLWFPAAAALSPPVVWRISIHADSNSDRQPIQCSDYACKQIQEVAKRSNPYGTLSATTCQPILLGPSFHSPGTNNWSDQLSKGDTSKFHPTLEVPAVESFIILDELLFESFGAEA